MNDTHATYLIGAVAQGIFALTLGMLALSDLRTRGAAWLAAASCLQLFMTLSRALLHTDPLVSLGSGLVVVVFSMIYMGLRWYVVREPLPSLAMPIGVGVAIVLATLLSGVNPAVGLAVTRLAAVSVMVATALMLVRAREPHMRPMAQLTAALLVGLIVTVLLRVGLRWIPQGNAYLGMDVGARVATMLLANAMSFTFVGYFVLETQRRLHEESRIDVLTGLRNRRSLEEVVARELGVAERQGTPLALLVIDVDLFKELNDTWGHATGDRALEALAAVLLRSTVPRECIARLGGEEFAVLLPGMGSEEAADVAEELRHNAEQIQMEEGEGAARITVSIGVSAWKRGEQGWIDMLRRADKALYRAKREGRNRVATWSTEDGTRRLRMKAPLLQWPRRAPAKGDVAGDTQHDRANGSS